MRTQRYDYFHQGVRLDVSFFGEDGGVEEIHACVQVTDTFLSYIRQLEELLAAVDLFLKERMRGVPVHYLLAPVCRPEWLIEMECMAVIPHCNLAYGRF